jgi:hypothetical protein
LSPSDNAALLGVARARLALLEAQAAIDPTSVAPFERSDLERRIANLMAQVAADRRQPYRADTEEGAE